MLISLVVFKKKKVQAAFGLFGADTVFAQQAFQ